MGNYMTCFGAEPASASAAGLGHVKGGAAAGVQMSLDLKEQPASPTSPQSPMIASHRGLSPATPEPAAQPAAQRELKKTADSMPEFDFDRFGSCDGARRSSGNGVHTWDPNDPMADYGDAVVMAGNNVPPSAVLDGIMAAHGVPTVDSRFLLPAPISPLAALKALTAVETVNTAAAIADVERLANDALAMAIAKPSVAAFEMHAAMAMWAAHRLCYLVEHLAHFYELAPTAVEELWFFMVAHGMPLINARCMLPDRATAGRLVAFGSLFNADPALSCQLSLAHMLSGVAVVAAADAFAALKVFMARFNVRTVDARFLLTTSAADVAPPASLLLAIANMLLMRGVHVCRTACLAVSATERLLAFMRATGVATVDAYFLLADSPASAPTSFSVLCKLQLASQMNLFHVTFKASCATEELLAFMGAFGVATVDARFLIA